MTTSFARRLGMSCVFIILFFSGAIAQEAAVTDNIRILFDHKGGFQLELQSDPDKLFHPLLNPSSENPAQFTLYKGNDVLPLKFLENTSSGLSSDPGFRGPTFQAGDVLIQLWGIDLSDISPGCNAIRYELENLSQGIMTINARLVLATFIGEQSREHFSIVNLSDNSKIGITDEQRVILSDYPKLVLSQKSAPEGGDVLALIVPTRQVSGIQAQRIIMANIRRLQNSGYNFDFEEKRAFNLLPFSVNESGIAFFYDSIVILPAQKTSLDFVFGTKADIKADAVTKIYARLSAIKSSPSTAISPTALPPKSPQSLARAQSLAHLNQLIERLNTFMGSENYTQGELEALLQSITDEKAKLQNLP